jgi:hypothetical protein
MMVTAAWRRSMVKMEKSSVIWRCGGRGCGVEDEEFNKK